MGGDLGDGEGDQVVRRRLLPRQRHRIDRARLVRRRLARSIRTRTRRSRSTRSFDDDEEVLVGQGAALRRQGHAGRAARAGPRRVRARPRADEAMGRRRRSRRPGSLAKTKLSPAVLHSTLGRHRRAHDPHVRHQRDRRRSTGSCSSTTSARATRRSSTSRSSRRARFGASASTRRRAASLSHWVVIDNGKIKNYQAVVPVDVERRAARREGAARAVRGLARRQPRRRTPSCRSRSCAPMHSFDPCLACAIHTLDPEGNEIARVKAL